MWITGKATSSSVPAKASLLFWISCLGVSNKAQVVQCYVIYNPINLKSSGIPKRTIPAVLLNKKSNNNEDEIIEAIVEDVIHGSIITIEESEGKIIKEQQKKPRKRDVFKSILRNLASLSLIDYKWRSEMFTSNEADRMMEESMATIQGKKTAAYVRPMHASKDEIGPLGKAEKEAVDWLSQVIEEEGKRAKLIYDAEGNLIRPMELEGGPLADLEREAVGFINEIVECETERVKNGTLRPMDTQNRGPLGEAEAKASNFLKEIAESEKTRMIQSRARGDVVRPIDIPGPLGEFEKVLVDVATAEKQRVIEKEKVGKLVRPKDISKPSVLGQVEHRLVEAINTLLNEEEQRLQSMKLYMEQKRPMETNSESTLGFLETFFVNLSRGPGLVLRVVQRVNELLASEKLQKHDILHLPSSNATVEAEGI